ncbi:hypothetical protein CTAYLR_010046 [Chrysophaeum taylorii]|uniref:NADP-dependent oxidoreductase domain-containing protein n=1 Tax=Chrysophaeum taylorii TaxID=2483200 RepID=A0AAD7UBH6_9STRA|nr:hypothetical protein CTAYLR_010046 [Chrysophaeum taylorii]
MAAAIPVVGLGTSRLLEREILGGIEAGARHLDCARFYGNEASVGRAIAASGVPRPEFFITTKVWPDWMRRVRESVEESLRDLQTSYVDLLLLHWPVAWYPNRPFSRDRTLDFARDVWPRMADLVREGKVRALGVSNFDQAQLSPLLGLDPPCAVNQIESHPAFHNDRLVEFCRANSILCVAWGPLGKGRVPAELEIIARSRRCSPEQVALRWNLDRGLVVIPRSSNPRNVRSNLEADALSPLDDDERRLVQACDRGRRRFPDVVGIWPATAHPLALALGFLLHCVASLLFYLFPLDLVALSTRRALKRELLLNTYL